ncbi:MAG: hypothetical protein ACT4QG_21150 [Sporichthyaceae bacterium]
MTRVVACLAGALLLAGCGGGPKLDEAKIERCATALVPYAKEGAAGKGLSLTENAACKDLNANEASEAIARMYRKLG